MREPNNNNGLNCVRCISTNDTDTIQKLNAKYSISSIAPDPECDRMRIPAAEIIYTTITRIIKIPIKLKDNNPTKGETKQKTTVECLTLHLFHPMRNEHTDVRTFKIHIKCMRMSERTEIGLNHVYNTHIQNKYK